MTIREDAVVAIIGMGYVGLPLAVAFAKKHLTIGFDLSQSKIDDYNSYKDPTGEVGTGELKATIQSGRLEPTTDPRRLSDADYLIIAVPTPVDRAHIPDFDPLISASITVGKHMKEGATVIYESTVYPGATEEICIPVLEKHSKRTWKLGFHVGYSPERINPGDREHTLAKIVKVVSGDTQGTLDKVAALYGGIVAAGVHKATSIKVAEAAKVIENTQRDLNIALMNELALIFDRMGIDTSEVLDAAATKWNFLRFRPGLVGGHCIGVDPYYLTHKAERMGYHPQVILAGRRINDGMGKFIAEKTIKLMIQQGISIREAKVTVLGLTFKENCADLRNSKVVDLIRELIDYGCNVHIHDPLASPSEAQSEYGIALQEWDALPTDSDVVVVSVGHREYVSMSIEKLTARLKNGAMVIDVKSIFNPEAIRAAGLALWRL